MFASEDSKPEAPLWRTLLTMLAPIVVAQACMAVREHLRREHKARLRRDAGPQPEHSEPQQTPRS